MKDKEARQATLANKKAIEHFFETERAFLDKFAELEVKIQDLTGRVAAIQLLLGVLIKGAFEDPEKTRDSIVTALVVFADKNMETLEKIEQGQSSFGPAFVDGSQSVLKSIHQLIKDAAT